MVICGAGMVMGIVRVEGDVIGIIIISGGCARVSDSHGCDYCYCYGYGCGYCCGCGCVG